MRPGAFTVVSGIRNLVALSPMLATGLKKVVLPVMVLSGSIPIAEWLFPCIALAELLGVIARGVAGFVGVEPTETSVHELCRTVQSWVSRRIGGFAA